MKSLLMALLGVAVLAAPVADTFAQAAGSTGGSQTTQPSGTATDGATGSSSVTTPPSGSATGTASGSVSTERRDDGASALPRSAVTERTTIFGLSPTTAVLIAAALLLVVVLAIVAMTRSSGGDYIDNRRL
jgi:hypothetical protein